MQNKLKNVEIYEKEGCAILSLSASVYPLDDIKKTCTTILKQALVVLDGDSEETIVEIQALRKTGIKNLVKKFLDTLIKAHKNESDKKKRR